MFSAIRTLFLFVIFCCQSDVVVLQDGNDVYYGYDGFQKTKPSGTTELSGGTIINEKMILDRSRSPYWLRNDIIIERNAELVIEPGVQVKVEPQVGITIRGILNAQGTQFEPILLTTAEESSAKTILSPDIRLVDGPSILAGRVQVRHNGKWRSVCTNSKNWTLADMETACRQMGFQGGSFFNWYDRQMPVRSRLLYEEPKCAGTEATIFSCQWSTRQLGSGVCDYHPDLGIQCLSRHDSSLPYWRGIRFEYAKHEDMLALRNILYVPTSLSVLKHVRISYAGAGRNQNTSSALHIQGVSPVMENLEITNCAFDGLNITQSEAPITINNCVIQSNRGNGVFINSTYGMVKFDGCMIAGNGGDGIKYVHAEERLEEKIDRNNFHDLCRIATASSQTFPIQMYAEQTIFSNIERVCEKDFNTRSGVLTLHFIRAVTDKNNSASIEVYDGSKYNNRLLTKFSIRNNTRPESVRTHSNQIFIRFRAEQRTNIVLFMRVFAGDDKSFDLNVTNSNISENTGRGIAVDNLRSQVHVHKSTVSNNEHVAGVHVTSGVGNINITESRISFNEGDGVNITYTGGSRNISRSLISSNKGYGIAIWLNNTKETEYIYVNQTTVVEYSEIYKNIETGVLHGNFCGDSFFNFSGNSFHSGLGDALEILSCWRQTNLKTRLQIGHNNFMRNEKICLRITPAVNIDATIEYNNFRQNTFGSILIENKPLEEFLILPSNIGIQHNYFTNNSGIFVINLAPSAYSKIQNILFTRNFVRNNRIMEPFQPDDGSVSKLNPRSRVAAPIVVGSDNVDIFRNIIENPDSKYEIGSHLEDQSKSINCTFNWLGFSNDEQVFHRIFHRFDRYNLAKILYIPLLIHNSNPLTTKYNDRQWYVPKFTTLSSSKVGGEIEGEEILFKGEYIVEKDINIRPGGKLTLEPGVILKFPTSIGMMVGGRLEARGNAPDSILFTLKEEVTYAPDNETLGTDYDAETEIITIEPLKPLKLVGGRSEMEGRLQVKINNQWGTVCNYKWTIKNAALVCNQLGFALNPDDWYLERNEIPNAGTEDRVLISNVDCDDFDLDIIKCRAEFVGDFENSCDHENDVGLRCYPTSWSGVRFGALADRSNVQYMTIEKAGLLDYATNAFKPALQLDFARQNFENIKVSNNDYHGLGILYSDIYTDDAVDIIKNSEFSFNKGAGISMKQLGLTVFGSMIENNHIGIEHNPVLSGPQQREFAGWFIKQEEEYHYNPFSIPYNLDQNVIHIRRGETKYLVTTEIIDNTITRSYKIECDPGWVIGIQLLNPIENRSTEEIIIKDALSDRGQSDVWILKRDLNVFPITSLSNGIILNYDSGDRAIGGTVIVLSSIRATVQNIHNRIVRGPIPSLKLVRSKIRSNTFGLHASYYNRYLNELGDHFLRKANESITIFNCEISHNTNEALFVHSPHWDLHKSNISEIVFMINNTLITDNGKGIYHFSRDMRSSNNLFHYILQDDTIERNRAFGFDIRLPYVWQYNENFTHSVYMDNNTWANNNRFGITIDGHFAIVNITNSKFVNNKCENGVLSLKGMEKKLKIMNNKFLSNNGKYIVEFNINSQSEIIGNVPAKFTHNDLRDNKFRSMFKTFGVLQINKEPTSVIRFKGVQEVNINRNLFSNNHHDYQLVAGIKTAKINNFLDVRENWWGTTLEGEIKRAIFDFNDWNDHALAMFTPYLLEDNFESSYSVTYVTNTSMSLDDLGGMLYENLVIPPREKPYTVTADLTVMPEAKLTIYPGVILEFYPNIGILVLGSLNAVGFKNNEIIMRPVSRAENLIRQDSSIREKRSIENVYQESIRLYNPSASETESDRVNEGFMEYFNKTTLQWIPMCDPRFTERNAQVVCRELGFSPLNVFFDHDIRIELHSNSLSRIWSWPEPLQCEGTEKRYEDCPIRLNGQQFGHRHECKWNSNFVFISCGQKNLRHQDYWGGIRFAHPDFEQELFSNRMHDVRTHTRSQNIESVLEYVKVVGAGILHNEKSAAIQSIIKSPKISYVQISQSAAHGINLISPTNTINLLNNMVRDTMGVGTNILSLTGEDRDSNESSFTPLQDLNVPYNLFSLIDICDKHKEITIEERVIVYYKYDNHPVNCVKIFRSTYNLKPLGFRLMQFNLFNSTVKYGIPDFISLYDGDIYNVTSKMLTRITMNSGNEKRMFRTRLPSMSVKLFANGASANHGFFAEIFTLPIPALRFNRDVQHNISTSVFDKNREGAILYRSVGEVNPIITIEKNQFKNNGEKLYGNFTTCRAAVDLDVQNTQNIYFRSNLLQNNQGGLWIRADSGGYATALKAWIHNNLFVTNMNLPALYIEGRHPSPYQEVTIYRNYFTRNVAQYRNNIILKQVVSNFTFNYIKRNIGLHNLEISGFRRIRLPYQSTTHNGFYHNFAVFRDSRSTIVAGTAGQQYVHNIFFNPDNDYEMVTVNRSLTYQRIETKIEAADNYWGINNTLAISGRIRDRRDDPRLLEVNFEPPCMNNLTILDNKKCPPGWYLVGETCYMYIGAPMTFHEAKEFCSADNASVPYLLGNINYVPLFSFLRTQDERFLDTGEGRVWVQHIDQINECTMFIYQSVEIADCEERRPFICEIDPKVRIKILPLGDDLVTIAVISSSAIGVLLIILVALCWWSKSKYRKTQRLERRNSIRQSLHSLRSVGLAPSTYSEASLRRKATQMSTRSTDTLTKNQEYKKMISNGSIDSMEKSAYDSSIEDGQSYDIYESSNQNPSSFAYNPTITYHKSPKRLEAQYAQPNGFELAYKNEGFRDTSTFASNSNYQSRADSIQDTATNEETPIIHENSGNSLSSPPSEYYNTDTLPLNDTLGKSDSTLEMKKSIEEMNNRTYNPTYSRERPNPSLLQELKSRLPQNTVGIPITPEPYQTPQNTLGIPITPEPLPQNIVGLPTPPDPPPKDHSPTYSEKLAELNYSPDFNTVALAHPTDDRPQSASILETNFDEPPFIPPKPKSRAKSEVLLETNFDYFPPDETPLSHPISDASRSKSQPLETAM